jgi:hypothetical protein
MLPVVRQRLDRPSTGHVVRLLLKSGQGAAVGGIGGRIRRVIHGVPGAYPNATGFRLSKPYFPVFFDEYTAIKV